MEEQESGQQQLKLCDNCKKEVSAVNFLIHTAHCQRNITLCKVCDEPFPRNEIHSHIADAHSKIRCSKCGEEIEQQETEKHDELDCTKRLVKCGFCEMDVQASDQTEHEDYCGSRTERCNVCEQYVMVKYQDIHNSSNHAFLSIEDLDRQQAKSSDPRTSCNYSDSNNFPKDDKDPLLIRARASPGKRTNDMPQINVSASMEKRKETNKPILHDLYDSSNRSDSSSGLSLEQLDRLLAMRMAEEEEQFQPPYTHSDLGDDAFRRTTAISGSANALLPTSDDFEDMSMLQDESLWTNHLDYRRTEGVDATTPAILEHGNRPEYHPIIRAPVAPEEGSSCLPCEFCNELFHADHLIDHQSYCQLGSMQSQPMRRLEESNLDRSELNNSRNLGNLREDTTTILNDLTPFSNSEPSTESDFGAILIPCEYCGAQFEADYIIEHQSGCNGVLNEEAMRWFMRDDPERAVPPKPKDEERTEQGSSRRHQQDPDMDYLDELFLKEAIENSLKDKNLAKAPGPDSPSKVDDREMQPSLTGLSLASPKVRHIPIQVAPDYGASKRIHNRVNMIREVKAQHANKGSPLVHRTGYEAPGDDRLPALHSNNAVPPNRFQRVDPTGARPKSFASRTSNESASNTPSVSKPEGQTRPVLEELQRSGSSMQMTGGMSTAPNLTRRSFYDGKDVVASNEAPQLSPRPVPPRRMRQNQSQY